MAAGLHIERTQVVPGHLFGLGQASLLVRLRCTPSGDDDALAERLLAAVAPHLPARSALALVPLAPHPNGTQLLVALADVVHRLQVAAGLTPSPQARLLNKISQHCTLALPGPVPSAVGEALAWAVQAFNAMAAEPLVTGLPEALWRAQASLRGRLARWAPGGTNKRHMLRVACSLNIPVLALPGGVFQFGWGRRSRLFHSTISDATSAIATGWAKNKQHTSALRRMAGLPVPEQAVVGSLETAIAAAQRIGYPVVIKPINLDQGTGVEAGLRNEAELRVAHGRSSRHASTLLLEKHVAGDDHRVYVMQGEMVGVARRTPARVTGDGVASVAELVAMANVPRRIKAAAEPMYKSIEIDDEALELLAREGLDAQSVPALGRVVALRRTANVSRGGSTDDVTDQIHPDNAALCVQAAALLRLDIAGLDLLITDISRSWREVGGAFYEINAQPQTGGAHPWMFEKILKRYVTGQGRIPTVLVLAQPGESPLARETVAALEHDGLRTGLVQGSGEALLRDCRAKLMAPDLAALVVVTDCKELLRWGLPLDRFDAMVIDGWLAPEPERDGVLGLLAPHVNRVLVPLAAPDTARLQQHWRPDQLRRLESAGALLPALLQALKDVPDGG